MSSQSESLLRDQIAANLSNLEIGLVLIRTEYPLKSSNGANGKIDILARDQVGHYVVIELKKSNATSRSALHELCKYIVLLQEAEGIARNEIRCILISTQWHELLVPFSYFHMSADVSVEGKRLIVDHESGFAFESITPLKIDDLPTFSPEFDLFVYDNSSERDEHIALMSSRAKRIPFIKGVVVLLDEKVTSRTRQQSCRSIVCLWRVNEQDFAKSVFRKSCF